MHMVSSSPRNLFLMYLFWGLCQVLVVACGILWPDQGLNLGPCIGSVSYCTTREVPLEIYFLILCVASSDLLKFKKI